MRCESAITAQTPSTSKSDTEKPEQREAVLEAKGLLYKRLKVVVKDGRELIGELLCLDKQGNLILGNTYEQVPSIDNGKERSIGQVLVPANHQKSCHVEVMPLEHQHF